MSLTDTDSDTSPAVILAAQDNFADSTDSMREREQDTPESPTSDEWEVVPEEAEHSDCGSSAKSLLLDDTPANSPDAEEDTNTELPSLHLRLLPQGSSDVTVHLTAQQQAGPPPMTPLTPGGLSDSARQQYQEQLRKAQETMLPQTGHSQHSRSFDITEGPKEQPSHQQPQPGSAAEEDSSTQDSVVGISLGGDPLEVGSMQNESFRADIPEVESLEELLDADLPTSTHMSMQDDAFDSASPVHSTQSLVTDAAAADAAADAATDAADDITEDPAGMTEVAGAAAGNEPFASSVVPFPVYDSTGELSFMSDGSFINYEDALPEEEDDEAEDEEQQQQLSKDEAEDVGVHGSASGGVSVDELSQQASDLAEMATQLSEESAEGEEERPHAATEAVAAADDSKNHGAKEEAEGDNYDKSSGFVASLQYHLGQLLSTIQAWTATAYASLPTSAAMYNSSLGVLGPKSPLRGLDRLHWSLASGLALLSAALACYIVKNHHMQKQVTSSSTELSRLLLKVINLQQSLQSPGRVPVIRHTSSIASITPFPLTHLM